jgi:hypothetical protein
LAALLLPGGAAAEAAKDGVAPELRVALAEYDRLRDADTSPAVTVVDLLRLTGSFQKHDLGVTLTGRTSGKRATVPILTGSAGLRLFGCDGEAILSRGASSFDLTPLAPKFTLRCRIAGVGSDRLELRTTAAVLWVEAGVADGEPIGTDSEDGTRQVSLVRVSSAAAGDIVKPSAVARYRLSLQPDETRFRYQLDVHNPNRARASFDVTLRTTEHVQQIDAQAAYDVAGARYRFDLPPGDGTIVLSGTFPGSSFTPPVDASVQYVLLEAHPLLRPLVQGSPRRISPGETGLKAEFRGGQAFLLNGAESLAWATTRLEALRATSFAVHGATHTYFITREGEMLAESTLYLDNQGAADITLPVKAEPTFASLGGEAVLLTRNPSGDLWMPLSQGVQSLVVQYRESLAQGHGFAWGRLPLPQVSAPATETTIGLRYPREWVPLFERFQSDSRLWDPGAERIFWTIVLAFWTGLVLHLLGVATRRTILLALCSGVALFAAEWALWAIIAADLAITALWFYGLSKRPGLAPLVVAAVAAMFVVWMVTMAGSLASRAGVSEAKLAYQRSDSDASLAGEAPKAAANYQGLPAKVTLPPGARRTGFVAEMLATETPRFVTVLLVRESTFALFGSALAGLALLLFLRDRRQIWSGFQTLLERALVRGRSPEPAPIVS